MTICPRWITTISGAGKPSCHKKFDEATAILAGDALLTYAFELLADRIKDHKMAAELIDLLAGVSGGAGMIAGQMADLQAQNTKGTTHLLTYINSRKTAKMFLGACRMGGITGTATESQKMRLNDYGWRIGMCFQITDDILDVTAGTKQLGKTAGKDVKQGKLTYPSLYGIEESKKLAQELTENAITALKPFGARADILRQLAQTMLERTK